MRTSITFTLFITFAILFATALEVSQVTKVARYEVPTIHHNKDSEKRDISDPVDFSLFAYGKRFDFKLVQQSRFSADTVIKTFDAQENLVSEVLPPSNHFATEDFHAQFTFFENGYVKGSFLHNGEMYYVDPTEEHLDEVDDDVKRSLSDTVIFRARDVLHVSADSSDESIQKAKSAKRAETTEILDVLPHGSGSGDTGPLFPYGDCTTRKTVKLGIVVDATYYNRAMNAAFPSSTITNSLVTDYITATIGTINQIYNRQFGVTLQISNLEIYPEYSNTPAWQEPNTLSLTTYEQCTNSLDNYLDPLFRNWVDAKTDGPDRTWHLFTDCWTVRFCGRGGTCSSVVGRAYLGILCTDYAGYNSGFSSWAKSPNGWLIIAHELGHNFNANHKFDLNGAPLYGIMSYAGTKVHEFTNGAFVEMCPEIKAATCMPTTTTCQSNCGTKTCGPSACEGVSCGPSCPAGQQCSAAGQCEDIPCTPNCGTGRCGLSDGCGGTCAACPCTDTCSSLGQECGTVCGQSCGTCGTGEYCSSSFVCLASSSPWLSAINEVRSDVGVSSLSWNTGLAEEARVRAASCNFNAQTGETVQRNAPTDTGDVVNLWAAESSTYDCQNNQCTGTCSNYLQLVWGETTQVGCSCEQCGSERFCVCRYETPGNTIGERPFSASLCPEETCTPNCTGKSCGASDGCDGTCGENADCGSPNSECVYSATGGYQCVCTPTVTCSGRCGTLVNDCGTTENCGSCGAGETCGSDNTCACNPISRTQACGTKTCGSAGNGCGGVYSCGSCPSEETCNNGQCEAETDTCSYSNAEVNSAGECVCKAGYKGTPETGCTRIRFPNGWKKAGCTVDCQLASSNYWYLATDGNSLSYKRDASNYDQSVAQWMNSESLSDFGTVTYAASVTLDENAAQNCAGLAIGVSSTSYLAVCLDVTYGLIARDQTRSYSSSYRSWWTLNPSLVPVVGQTYDMQIKLMYWGSTQVIQVYVDNQMVAGTYSTSYWPQISGNAAGLYASGRATFKDVILRTSTQVVLNVGNCEDPNLDEKVARILGVPVSSISVDTSQCNKKRQGESVVVVTISSSVAASTSPAAVAATPSAAVLGSSLVSSVSAVSPAVAAAGITSATVAAEVTGTIIAGAAIATGSAVLGVSMVTAVIAGSAAVVAVGGGVTAAVVLSNNAEEEKEEEMVATVTVEEPVKQENKPKGATINIFEMDPTKAQSITARQPEIVRN